MGAEACRGALVKNWGPRIGLSRSLKCEPVLRGNAIGASAVGDFFFVDIGCLEGGRSSTGVMCAAGTPGKAGGPLRECVSPDFNCSGGTHITAPRPCLLLHVSSSSPALARLI